MIIIILLHYLLGTYNKILIKIPRMKPEFFLLHFKLLLPQ